MVVVRSLFNVHFDFGAPFEKKKGRRSVQQEKRIESKMKPYTLSIHGVKFPTEQNCCKQLEHSVSSIYVNVEILNCTV